jgi:hypothetical protein
MLWITEFMKLSPLIAKGIPTGKAYFKLERCLELVGKGT